MKKLISFIFGAALASVLLGTSLLAEDKDDNGGLLSLRGSAELAEGTGSEEMKRVQRDQEPISRDYLHQPPLIPHQIRNYRINIQSNKCLSCHSWKNYRKSGATKISMTHFETRDGQQLSSVSPRRYFCTQCHATQADAKPLIENDFKPVDELTK
ncbi:MAG: nitrate reductase cytochrome c-type subunit; periplasmic nitrate reductase electron transfer subunit [Gammaproteobacteria bacterium]|nr:MAG: nitrate reductase cytochrome c-type subunit; periplasmic nitrate reductase electron transfer subunit [Gammaproteobacteria bacterium]